MKLAITVIGLALLGLSKPSLAQEWPGYTTMANAYQFASDAYDECAQINPGNPSGFSECMVNGMQYAIYITGGYIQQWQEVAYQCSYAPSPQEICYAAYDIIYEMYQVIGYFSDVKTYWENN